MVRHASTLAGLTIASFVALFVYAMANLSTINSDLRREVGESNLWAATQAEREAQQVIIALANGFPDPEANDVALRFEILYSRLVLLADSPQLAYFRSIGEEDTLHHAMRLIDALDAYDLTALDDAGTAESFLTGIAGLADVLRGLANRTSLAERLGRLDSKDEQLEMMRLLLIAVLGVFASGSVMAGLLLRNLRRLVQTQNALQTHQARLEETIAARTRELRDALQLERRAKEIYQSFTITVSHQFRTPVSIIHMIAQRQIRSDDPGMTDDLRRKFVRIFDAAVRLERLLTGFLATSRPDGDAITLNRRTLDFRLLLATAVQQVQEVNPNRSITMDLGDRPVMLDGDPVLLEQVVLNLLTNAVKYSAHPAPVTVVLRVVDGTVQFEVIDSGMGIPAAAQAAIFEKFYRAPNVHRLPGVGVGLSLAREIVAQHSGTIRFTSQEGVGTTFAVDLPAKGETQHDHAQPERDHSLH